MSINKINPAEKLQTVHLILEGKETQRHARTRLGVSLDALQQWIRIYKSEGQGSYKRVENKINRCTWKERYSPNILGNTSLSFVYDHCSLGCKPPRKSFALLSRFHFSWSVTFLFSLTSIVSEAELLLQSLLLLQRRHPSSFFPHSFLL